MNSLYMIYSFISFIGVLRLTFRLYVGGQHNGGRKLGRAGCKVWREKAHPVVKDRASAMHIGSPMDMMSSE